MPTERSPAKPNTRAARRGRLALAAAGHRPNAPVRVRPPRLPWNLAGVALAIVAVAAAFAIAEPSNRDAGALLEVRRISAVNAILATGMTLLLASGGIDLSVGSVLALSAVAMSCATDALTRAGLDARGAMLPSLLAAAAGLAVGAACGAVNGALVVVGRIPPFLATLGMLLVGRGLTYDLLGASSRSGIPFVAREIGRTPVGASVAALAVVAAGLVLLARTKFGRALIAIGGNEEAARLSGIAVGRAKAAAYVASGAIAGVAGGVLAGRTGVVTNTDG